MLLIFTYQLFCFTEYNCVVYEGVQNKSNAFSRDDATSKFTTEMSTVTIISKYIYHYLLML